MTPYTLEIINKDVTQSKITVNRERVTIKRCPDSIFTDEQAAVLAEIAHTKWIALGTIITYRGRIDGGRHGITLHSRSRKEENIVIPHDDWLK